jgi:hypothetical protein
MARETGDADIVLQRIEKIGRGDVLREKQERSRDEGRRKIARSKATHRHAPKRPLASPWRLGSVRSIRTFGDEDDKGRGRERQEEGDGRVTALQRGKCAYIDAKQAADRPRESEDPRAMARSDAGTRSGVTASRDAWKKFSANQSATLSATMAVMLPRRKLSLGLPSQVHLTKDSCGTP